MSYVDKSNAWVLDQFLTYIDMNTLGGNDKHIVDNFSVEHNWNVATADGTHKENSILGSYVNTSPISTGSQVIASSATWTPAAGVYQLTFIDDGIVSNRVHFQLYISGTWRGDLDLTTLTGIFFFDGTNMRIYNNGSIRTAYYQKF